LLTAFCGEPETKTGRGKEKGIFKYKGFPIYGLAKRRRGQFVFGTTFDQPRICIPQQKEVKVKRIKSQE
jgi:hypothetical protein